jgi:hypothetical protein
MKQNMIAFVALLTLATFAGVVYCFGSNRQTISISRRETQNRRAQSREERGSQGDKSFGNGGGL